MTSSAVQHMRKAQEMPGCSGQFSCETPQENRLRSEPPALCKQLAFALELQLNRHFAAAGSGDAIMRAWDIWLL